MKKINFGQGQKNNTLQGDIDAIINEGHDKALMESVDTRISQFARTPDDVQAIDGGLFIQLHPEKVEAAEKFVLNEQANYFNTRIRGERVMLFIDNPAAGDYRLIQLRESQAEYYVGGMITGYRRNLKWGDVHPILVYCFTHGIMPYKLVMSHGVEWLVDTHTADKGDIAHALIILDHNIFGDFEEQPLKFSQMQGGKPTLFEYKK